MFILRKPTNPTCAWFSIFWRHQDTFKIPRTNPNIIFENNISGNIKHGKAADCTFLKRRAPTHPENPCDKFWKTLNMGSSFPESICCLWVSLRRFVFFLACWFFIALQSFHRFQSLLMDLFIVFRVYSWYWIVYGRAQPVINLLIRSLINE